MDYHPFVYLIFFDLYSFIYECLFVLLSRAHGLGWAGVCVCVHKDYREKRKGTINKERGERF